MAEILLSSLISIVTEKAVNHVLQQFAAMRGIKEDLEKLGIVLLDIQSKLRDAEEKQATDEAVKKWLETLKNAAYDADDILDEFNYEAQRCKAKIQDNMINKVLDFFSLHNPSFLFRLIMGKKLKDMVEKIDRIAALGDRFKFREQAQPHTEDRTQTHSYVDETEVIGREEDKEKIVQLLLDQHEDKKVTVLPIVGMGGLGKTTLAQLVCGEQRVKEHFNKLMWVCVSEEFNVAKMANSIVGSATGEECNMSSMDLLQKSLREELSGKIFLLVLDDVWSEDPQKWDAIKVLLESGREGSAIMVTTRSGKVSEIMGTLDPYYLSCLSKDDSWTLFSNRAFKSRAEERRELIEIGTRIVEKCGGLPLAVKALGSLMRTKQTEKEWQDVLTSEIWDTKVDENGILPALRLSYNHLSPHLKQCFAFCSVFPKDYWMEKDMLIQLWIANGFIPSKGRMDLEILGQEIFHELVWRSFFQNLKQYSTYFGTDQNLWLIVKDYQTEYGYPGITRCTMHDLIHDLAQSVMKSECATLLEYTRMEELPDNIRHLFTEGPRQVDIDRILNKYPTIFTLLLRRTSLAIENADLSKAKSLKVLVLQFTNSIELLPVKIRHLKHLRYLDLSLTDITEIPEAMCELFNLQTLKLNYCMILCKLPEAMRNMRSLRHLYLRGCPNLKHMPGGMGQLSSLQTLTKYIVGDYAERGIRELKGLNLGGELGLYGLEKVKDMEDASEVNLSSKQNIQSLALCWGVLEWNYFTSERPKDHYFDEEVELQAQNVLAALEPHSGLKKLVVWRYMGLRFPMWMMDGLFFRNTVEIHLGYCKKCEHLPPLWQLPSLAVLFLKQMDSIKHLQSSESEGTMQAFPSLKELTLEKMQSLESWWGEKAVETAPPCFHHLVCLRIVECPNLTTMPVAPSLRDLAIKGSNQIPLKSMLTLTTLSILDIETSSTSTSGGTLLPSFSKESISFKQIKSLEELNITGGEELRPLMDREDETRGFSLTLLRLHFQSCDWLFASQPSISPLKIWTNLTSLRELVIENSDALVSWPQKELQGLISLDNLFILNCQNLTGTSVVESSSSALGEGELAPHLKTLYISNCKNLVDLPRLPTSLESLFIRNCPNLKALTDQLGHLPPLKQLDITECTSLTSLLEGMQGFTALQHLWIGYCPQLTSLPQALQRRLPYLLTLDIWECPDLERRFKRGGEYWHLISSMPAPQIGMRRSQEPPSLFWRSCLDCFSPM